jgi:uncharacterized protein with PIN domain
MGIESTSDAWEAYFRARKRTNWRQFLRFRVSPNGFQLEQRSNLASSVPYESFTNWNASPAKSFDDLLHEARFEIGPVTQTQARIAREAYRDFGRASGHQARLNFGDCFAYALAKAMNEPLLFKGDDFTRTDITSALA